MPANITPIFPIAPLIGIATLTAPTPITSRANITGTTGLVQLTPVSTNGKRIDSILVKAKGTTVLGNVIIWLYNGTTSFIWDEFDVLATTATASSDSFALKRNYIDEVLPPSFQLYVSSTVANDVNVFANGGDY